MIYTETSVHFVHGEPLVEDPWSVLNPRRHVQVIRVYVNEKIIIKNFVE